MLKTGNQLRAARSRVNMHQPLLAKKAGVRKAVVAAMEAHHADVLRSDFIHVLAVQEALEDSGVEFLDTPRLGVRLRDLSHPWAGLTGQGLRTGDQVREARQLANMSQKALAEAAGRDGDTIRRMEGRGPKTFLSGLDTVLAVQQALDEAGIEITQTGRVTIKQKPSKMISSNDVIVPKFRLAPRLCTGNQLRAAIALADTNAHQLGRRSHVSFHVIWAMMGKGTNKLSNDYKTLLSLQDTLEDMG